MFKKYGSLLLLVCILIIFVLLLVNDKKQGNEPVDTNTIVNTKTPIKSDESPISETMNEDNKQLSSSEYEEIIRGYYDSKNYAIDNGENTFLNDFLEEGSKFKEKVLEEVKTKNKTKYSMVVFKEVKNIEGNVHTILVEVYDKDKKRDVIFKIKSRKGSSYVILNEK